MKLIDSIKEMFLQYPSIYSKDFDIIKHTVCHQMFITLGNGYKWAYTKDPKKGGYLIEPKYKILKEDYIRKIDMPYGKKVIHLDIDLYLKADKIYQLFIINHEGTKRDKEFFKEFNIFHIKSKHWDKRPQNVIYIEETFNTLPPKTLMPNEEYNESYEYFLEEVRENNVRESPYPNFSKEYSCFWEDSVKYIQNDWREEAINHLNYHVDYFNDNERMKTYSHNPTSPENISDYDQVLKNMKNEIMDGKLKKNVLNKYGFENFDLNDPRSFNYALQQKWNKDLNDIHSFLTETIDRLKNL